VNGLTLIALIAIALGAAVVYRAGLLRGRHEMRSPLPAAPASKAATAPPVEPLSERSSDHARIADERTRLVLSYEAECHRLRGALAARAAEAVQLREFADERRALHVEIARARADTARYRQIVVDIEDNAPPPLLASPHAPDDLKLIVGVGPVLERMLQQLGIATYRQIARWSQRDVDEFDARLHEFPGRIRRDDWVTQARELHQSKYGESAVSKERS
jgi:predicted flap endonuclease-1-like 5' DNA nuclease